MSWYTIYTKHRHEDSVASRLQDIRLEVLNPRLKHRKYQRNRLIEVIEPLFPCYLFANFDKDKYSHLINYTRGVRYIVGKGNPIVVHDEIINTIRDRMENGNLIVIKPQRFEKGEKVIIKDGPFKDFYGIFEREVKGPERVMILLDAIYYKLEIDSCFLGKM
ncbi:MAG: transcription termination/antitermination protein NusG [Nitrospirota bacterium]